MVYFDLFGPWGRILFVIIGALAVLIGILLLACFFTPGCIGYECIQKRNTAGKSGPLQLDEEKIENRKLNNVSYRSWRSGSLYEDGNNGTSSKHTDLTHKYKIGTISENFLLESDPRVLHNGEFGNTEPSPALHLIYTTNETYDKKITDFPTELTMSLQYLPPCSEIITGKLVIGIEALSSLPPKQYNCTLEPYVVLNIMKKSWSLKKGHKLHYFRTRGVRHTISPIYKETFIVPNVQPNNIKEWILDISVLDHDRYANHTELCTLKVPLKDVKKILQSPEVHLFHYKMKPCDQEFGRILLGISHLPTARRLTVNIMKLRDVKFSAVVQNVKQFNFYVKVLMLSAKTGRKLQKKKTKSLHGVAQPIEFNETLTFDLAVNELDTLQFLIVLCNKVVSPDVLTTSIDYPSDSEDSINSYRKTKDIFIGKVALGKGVRGLTERLHWFSVRNNPRKLITVWHTLK